MRPLTHEIILTEFDRNRLDGLLQVMRARSGIDPWSLDALELELKRARIVPAESMLPNVVTMNSHVRLVDVISGVRTSVSLVFPFAGKSDASVPVLSPLGLALLGCREGDLLAWDTPEGPRRLRIERVVYQPEAAGDYLI